MRTWLRRVIVLLLVVRVIRILTPAWVRHGYVLFFRPVRIQVEFEGKRNASAAEGVRYSSTAPQIWSVRPWNEIHAQC